MTVKFILLQFAIKMLHALLYTYGWRPHVLQVYQVGWFAGLPGIGQFGLVRCLAK